MASLDAALTALRSLTPPPGAEEAASQLEQARLQLAWKIAPALRLGRERPAMVVFAGHTNAGKSSLINHIAGMTVSAASESAAATRAAVAAADSEGLEAIGPGGYLSELKRADGAPEQALKLHWHLLTARAEGVPDGTVWVDSPDVSTLDVQNRELGQALALAADLVIFVSTPQTYADALPLELLAPALRGRAGGFLDPGRGRGLVVLLNMVNDGGQADRILTHLDETILPSAGLTVSPALRLWAPWVRPEPGRPPELSVHSGRKPIHLPVEVARLARASRGDALLAAAEHCEQAFESARLQLLERGEAAERVLARLQAELAATRDQLAGQHLPFLEAVEAAAQVRSNIHHPSYAWIVKGAQAPGRLATWLWRRATRSETEDPYADRDKQELARIAEVALGLRTRLLESLEDGDEIARLAAEALRATPRGEDLSAAVAVHYQESAGGSRELVDQLVEDWRRDLEERPMLRSMLGLADLGLTVGGATIGVVLGTTGVQDLVIGVGVPVVFTAAVDRFGYPQAVRSRYQRFLELRAEVAVEVLERTLIGPVSAALSAWRTGEELARAETALTEVLAAARKQGRGERRHG